VPELGDGFGGLGSWQNQAIPEAYGGEPDDDAIASVDAWYVERGAAPQINVTPHIHPGLLQRVTARGYQCKEVELVYAIDLHAAAIADPPPPTGVAFESIDRADAARVGGWARLNTLLFFGEGEHTVHVDAARRGALADRSYTTIVTHAGEDIACAGSESIENMVALWGAAVREDHRRKGIQLALILERLGRARDLGARYATIASVARIGTERNAMRAGMALVYPRLEMVRPGDGLTPSA